MKIILFIVWIIFSYLEGKRDASFYNSNMTSSNPVKENLHWLFSVTRGIVLGLIFYLSLTKFSLIVTLIYVLSLVMIFSFLHNGVYFYTRNKLDSNVYPKGFKDDSVSSTAKFNFSFTIRTIMAIIGVIGIIITLFIK